MNDKYLMGTRKVDVLLFTDQDARLRIKAAGAYRIASELRKLGLSVLTIDYTFSFTESELDGLLSIIDIDNLRLVGFSNTFATDNSQGYLNEGVFLNGPTPPNDDSETELLIKLRRKIRALNSNIKFVVGGARTLKKLPTFNKERDLIDYAVIGVADQTVVDLANHIFKGGPLKFNLVNNIKVLDYDTKGLLFDFSSSYTQYQKEDIISPSDVLPLEVARGCMFKCKFCSYPLIGRKKSDPKYHKDISVLRDELKRNYEEFGVNQYLISDDTLNETNEKIEGLLEAQVQANVKIRYSCYARLDLITRFPEQKELLKESGLVAPFFGIESLNHKTAKAVGKGLHPDEVKQTLIDVKSSWGSRVGICCSFIIGLPYESEETIAEWFPWVANPSSPIDYIILLPLSGISSDLQLIDEEELYTLLPDDGWENKHWSSSIALTLKNKLTKEVANRQRWGGFTGMGGINMGLSNCLGKPMAPDWGTVKMLYEHRLRLYKTRLFLELGTNDS